jgi:ribosomal protein L11 methyltransferase
MRFGDRLWICPTGSQVAQTDAVVIDLDPGLAFGTGTHPTTALCLQWLDGYDLSGKTAIDFGCGSGVLAVAALKLGAVHAIAVDHDPQAVLATRDNAERNGVADRIDVVHSADFTGGKADVVIANILANVLIDLAPKIGGLVADGGRLVMSGILAGQEGAVATAYAGGFSIASPRRLEGWVLLDGIRTNTG